MVDESASHALNETIIMHHDRYQLEKQTISQIDEENENETKYNETKSKKRKEEKNTPTVWYAVCGMRILIHQMNE